MLAAFHTIAVHPDSDSFGSLSEIMNHQKKSAPFSLIFSPADEEVPHDMYGPGSCRWTENRQ
jgi:hypothetical protein